MGNVLSVLSINLCCFSSEGINNRQHHYFLKKKKIIEVENTDNINIDIKIEKEELKHEDELDEGLQEISLN